MPLPRGTHEGEVTGASGPPDMPLIGQVPPLASRPGFPLQSGPKGDAAFTSVRDLGGEGAMPVRFEHRHLEGTAAMAAPAAARILGLLLLIRP